MSSPDRVLESTVPNRIIELRGVHPWACNCFHSATYAKNAEVANMQKLEFEVMEAEPQLACYPEPETNEADSAAWGGAGLTTSAIWGGRISKWDSAIPSEKSGALTNSAEQR
jgi:hypothetical protein